MKKYFLLVSMIGCLLFWAANPAQAYEWEGIQITPRVTIQEMYDDNVTRVKRNTIDDLRSDLSAGISFVKDEKTQTFGLDGEITRQMFWDNDDFDNTSGSLKANYGLDLSKHGRLELNDTYYRSTDPATFADAFGVTNGRQSRDHNLFNARYNHSVNNQLAWHTSYENQLINYRSSSQVDASRNSAGGGLDYSLDSANIISGNYMYHHQDLDPGDSATDHEVSANYRHFFTTRLYMDAQAGVDMINDYNGEDKTHPLYRLALTQDTDENTQIGISLEKRYTLGLGSADIFNSWRLAGNVIKQLSARLQGLATIFYGEGKYLTSSAEEEFAGLDAELKFELTKQADLKVGYSFSTKNTSNETEDFQRNAVYCGATVRF